MLLDNGATQMKIIVTGGAGFIGSFLVERLLHGGENEVVALDNFARGRQANLAAHADNPALHLLHGDIRDRALLEHTFGGADVVYHLAAQSNVMGAVSDLDYSFTTNVHGTYNVLAAARNANVRRVVFSSSREVYGEVDTLPVAEDRPFGAKNGYGASKAAGELYCNVFHATYGLETAVLRFANVYGMRDFGRVIPLWFDAVKNGQNLIVYGGKQVIDFVHVDQVVETMIRASTAPIIGQPINIGSGQGTPILVLAERILALSASESQLDLRPARSVEVARFTADVRLMRDMLNIEPPADPLFALDSLWQAWQGSQQ